MTCNYFTYKDMIHELFYEVPLTDIHMNNAIETLRQYIVNGGAVDVANALGIGVQEMIIRRTEQSPEEVIRRRFVFISGERKGAELSIHEIEDIGLFLKHGPYYGTLKAANN